MRVFVIIILCLFVTNVAEAMLLALPEISSAAIDPHDPNVIYLRFKSTAAAISTNGGQTFQAIDAKKIPANLDPNLNVGPCRYVIAGRDHLFRSDDSGATWTDTAASSFMRDQSKAESDRWRIYYWDTYGSRLPSRSSMWYLLFGLFAGCYLLLIFFALRGQGWPSVTRTCLRGAVVLLFVCGFLWFFHGYIMNLVYPDCYGISACPNPKLGVAMAIASQPLPLLVYLLALWPLLPGSLSIMSGCGSSPMSTRRRVAFILSVVVGSLFIVFHVCMIAIGNFWTHV